MASFSNSVKEEICSSINDKDKRYACLYGILLYCRHISERRILIQTESEAFAKLLSILTNSVYEGKIPYSLEKSERSNGAAGYTFTIDGYDAVFEALSFYGISISSREINLTHIVNNSLNVFLAGVFLACGSVTDPYKEYHLEFNAPVMQLYKDLNQILLSFGIEAGMTKRKNSYVLYVKYSENIEDILAFIGARQCTIDLMNVKIYKDVRNKANRIANCDSANIDKVIAASSKQISDIEFIQSCGKFETLPSDLKEVAELRLENPEISLKEIGELLKKPIGRSGVNRRFQKISKIAEELKI